MQLEQQILAHAARSAPEESCGLVLETPDGLCYQSCYNSAACPESSFEISPDEWLKAHLHGEIHALVHSHPDGPPYLSEADRAMQRRTACPWWLVAEQRLWRFRNIPPLLGREFIHGESDCYTLFRDAYHLAGIELPQFYRQDEWWLGEAELYLDNMLGNGFTRIDDAGQPGDIILICFGSAHANHAAIYCGEQTLLHHVPHRLSRRDIYGGYWRNYTHSIWRHQAWQPSAFTAICNDMAAALP